jgi:hypothetical protein
VYLHDTARLESLLDTIENNHQPLLYEEEYELFEEIIYFMRSITQNDTAYYSLTGEILETAFQYANSEYAHAALAQNIISDVQGDVFEYPFEYPVEAQQRRQNPESEQKKIIINDAERNFHFSLFPNPNNGTFELEYQVKSENELTFEVISVR